MPQNFPEYRKHLQSLIGKLRKERPGILAGFNELHKGAFDEGVLDLKTRELIALGISIAARCDGCIAYHVRNALHAKANRDEILDTVTVAIYMGGGPSLMYGCEALSALDQYTENHK